MKQYGLIGYPLTHSFSKKYFEEKFAEKGITDCAYNLFPIPSIEALPDLLSHYSNLCGLNVTIPYKQKVMHYLHEVDDVVSDIGAVNCIKVADGKLTGYNTDAFGFRASLNQLLGHKPDIAFVLGTGGAAKAVWYVLNKSGIPFLKVSTSGAQGSITYTDMESRLQGSNLIVNTTPLGTYPHIATYPAIPYHRLTGNDYLFDLVYNPAETQFLHKAKAKGAAVMNGLLMLEQQAEESWRIWNL